MEKVHCELCDFHKSKGGWKSSKDICRHRNSIFSYETPLGLKYYNRLCSNVNKNNDCELFLDSDLSSLNKSFIDMKWGLFISITISLIFWILICLYLIEK